MKEVWVQPVQYSSYYVILSNDQKRSAGSFYYKVKMNFIEKFYYKLLLKLFFSYNMKLQKRIFDGN